MIEFSQKKGFSTRKHVLYEDKIVVESKNLNQFDKYEINLEKIGSEIHYQADNPLGRKIFIWGNIGVIILVIIWELTRHSFGKVNLAVTIFCCVVMLFLAIIKEPVDSIFLMGGEKNLIFFRASPSEKEVLIFIDKVISMSKNKIKNKYLDLDEMVGEEEYMARLSWLRETEVITKKEFKKLKEEFEINRLL